MKTEQQVWLAAYCAAMASPHLKPGVLAGDAWNKIESGHDACARVADAALYQYMKRWDPKSADKYRPAE